MRRFIFPIFALLLAGGTAVFVNAWLEDQKRAAIANAQQVTIVAEPDFVEVLVAAERLTPGQFVKPGALRWQKWPDVELPASYLVRGVADETAFEGAVARQVMVPGDPIVPDATFTTMYNPKMYLNKAFDNRIGIAAAVEVINKLKGVNHPNTVFGVGTVQEEVGLRGAATAAWAVDPDIAFIADVSLATDGPDAKKHEKARLGSGPSINVLDGTMIAHRKLRDFVIDTADAEGIPYHLGALARGGTDGGRIHISRTGVPSIYVGIATRYIHSHTSIMNRDDFDNLVKLLLAVIKKLDKETVKKLTER